MQQREAVLNALEALSIPYELDEHMAVYTIEDIDKVGIFDKGCGCKNLFLRNASGKQHYLAVIPEHKQVNMKALAKSIGSSRLSFASAERLQEHLKLQAGEVTPLAAINDEQHAVTVVLDNDLKGEEKIGLHPNDNTATVWISFDGLMRYINHFGNEVIMAEV